MSHKAADLFAKHAESFMSKSIEGLALEYDDTDFRHLIPGAGVFYFEIPRLFTQNARFFVDVDVERRVNITEVQEREQELAEMQAEMATAQLGEQRQGLGETPGEGLDRAAIRHLETPAGDFNPGNVWMDSHDWEARNYVALDVDRSEPRPDPIRVPVPA